MQPLDVFLTSYECRGFGVVALKGQKMNSRGQRPRNKVSFQFRPRMAGSD